MHTILYSSQYTGDEHSIDSDLLSICHSSKRNNPVKNITGVLFYHQRNFLQAIEGEQSDLEKLMSVLEKDSRHCNIRRVFDEKILEKSFSQWNMDVFNIDDNQSIDYEKIIDFKNIYNNVLTHIEAQLFIESLKEFLADPKLRSVYS